MTVVVADGAPWLWSLAELHFPDAIQVLDWYHLKARVCEVGEELYGADRDSYQQWTDRILDLLWQSRWKEAVQELEKERRRVRSKAKRESLRRLVGYIRNNRERIDYARYRELGIPLGSGRVEGACRHLVGKRCKGSGMRNWKPSRCESILALRAGVYERRFYHLWEQHVRPAP